MSITWIGVGQDMKSYLPHPCRSARGSSWTQVMSSTKTFAAFWEPAHAVESADERTARRPIRFIWVNYNVVRNLSWQQVASWVSYDGADQTWNTDNLLARQTALETRQKLIQMLPNGNEVSLSAMILVPSAPLFGGISLKAGWLIHGN